MPLGANRRKSKIPSWVGYVGDMRTPQAVLSEKNWLSGWFPVKFLNSFFRSLGAVAFANNPLTGILIFLGMCVGNIEVAISSLMAGFLAFLTCKMLSVNDKAICGGIPLFNSILVGAISAAVAPTVFNIPLYVTLWCGIAVAAVVTVFVDQGLNSLMIPCTLPAQSVPFNMVIVVLMVIINMDSSFHKQDGVPIEQMVTSTDDILEAINEIGNLTDDAMITINNTNHNIINWVKVWHGVLLSTGQVYGVGTPTPSVFIWLGFLICSPLLAILMACGATIGSVFGALLSPALLPEVYQGLWGYNSLLAAGGIVFFNVPSPVCVIAALFNAFIAVCVQAVLLPIFSTTAMPVFSYPFNVAIMLVLAIGLKKDSPMILIADLSFPEFHLYKCYNELDQEDNLSNIEDGEPLNRQIINVRK